MKTLFELCSCLRLKFFCAQKGPKVIPINNQYSILSAQKIIIMLIVYTGNIWNSMRMAIIQDQIIIDKHIKSMAIHGRQIALECDGTTELNLGKCGRDYIMHGLQTFHSCQRALDRQSIPR